MTSQLMYLFIFCKLSKGSSTAQLEHIILRELFEAGVTTWSEILNAYSYALCGQALSASTVVSAKTTFAMLCSEDSLANKLL